VTHFVLVFKRIYRQIDGRERVRWYSEVRKAPNLGRALLWLAGYCSKRDWRNSQIKIITIVKIDRDVIELIDPINYSEYNYDV